MIDYKKIIKNRELRLKLVSLLRFIPDKPYLQLVYFIKNGSFMDLKHPQTFCEKLNWLKLNGYKPEYSDYVDKLKARDIVKEKLGEDISIPLLGAWRHYKDIDFDALPEQFVLKCNHDSGSVKIITDKSKIDHEEFEKFFEGRLKIDNSILGRDYYRNITPYIIAEKFMSEIAKDLIDYKFFCFNEEPKMLLLIADRFNDETETYFDMNGNRIPISNDGNPASDKVVLPAKFEKMKEYAKILSHGTKFVRIDLYEIENKIYFGEFTFFEAGGFYPFHPDEWEKKLGDWINLNN